MIGRLYSNGARSHHIHHHRARASRISAALARKSPAVGRQRRTLAKRARHRLSAYRRLLKLRAEAPVRELGRLGDKGVLANLKGMEGGVKYGCVKHLADRCSPPPAGVRAAALVVVLAAPLLPAAGQPGSTVWVRPRAAVRGEPVHNHQTAAAGRGGRVADRPSSERNASDAPAQARSKHSLMAIQGARDPSLGWRMAFGPAVSVEAAARSEQTTAPAGVAESTEQEITITLPGEVKLVLVHIPAGTFLMGSPARERGRGEDETLHQVTLTEDYYIGKYEVTQRQWQALMGSNPSYFTSCGLDCPVERVSWDDICGGATGSSCTAGSFLGKLNAYLEATGQPGAGKFRLPTEAEWERAARGGTTKPFAFGSGVNAGSDTGCEELPAALPAMWWCHNSDSTTHPVGLKQPNAYGLYDVHGNVWEWVGDWYGEYPTEAVTDPQGPAVGSERVARGGGWFSRARHCRFAYRNYLPPAARDGDLGFRLARSR